MTFALICRTLATSAAILSIAAGTFLVTDRAIAQADTGNQKSLATLEQKSQAGDPVAQFSLSVKAALNSRP